MAKITCDKGVEITIEGDYAIVRVNLTGDYGPSSTGKTTVVASTGGNKELPGGLRLGLNCYKKTF